VDERAFVIESEGELVGLIQFHEENEPNFRHAAIGRSPDGTRRDGLLMDLLAREFETDKARW
jgi:RimJ/RimL family protein N-acetyltransferase